MNIHLYTTILSTIESWAMQGGYTFLFIAAVVEGLPLIGTVVPGHTVVIIGGFLAQIGVLNIWLVILLASCGAVVGDMTSFYLGRRYGMKLIERFRIYFSIKEEYINKTRTLVSSHTGKALIVGRFNPLTRSLMPFVVGTGDTSTEKFWLFNIIGGVSWATLSVLVGYVFGIGYHAAAGFFGKAVVIAIAAAALIIWGYRFANMRFQVFRKYELFVLALCLISFWGIAETIQDAWATHSFMANFDLWVNLFMATHVTPFVAHLARLITTVGGTAVTLGAGIILGIYFCFRKKWRSASITLFAMIVTSAAVELSKAFFLRVRPENALQVILNDPSFPSGHASLAAALFVIVAYLFAPKFKSRIWREIFLVLCVLAAFLIGLSRIILNVHWSSDVIAGWSLGTFCATGGILLVRYLSVLVQRKQS